MGIIILYVYGVNLKLTMCLCTCTYCIMSMLLAPTLQILFNDNIRSFCTVVEREVYS